ncbi:MAG: winged helix-turn-helix transcriptional regulator [Polyangiaceae bacterium]|nr:winged helix-turn-helix transcriptional regulator [Polyangiaceae bacterium]
MSLRQIVRHLRVAARAAEQEVGVPPAQLFVLSQLAGAPAASIRELAERTLTDPSSVSVVLAKLEAKKLVARAADERDRRRSIFTLTPKGRSAVGRAPMLPQVRLIAALEALPEGRARAIATALDDLVAALGAEHVEPVLLFEDEPRAAKKGANRGS